MPLPLAPMTELEAVNTMLQSIGQAPVNTLEISGITDVSSARTFLHNSSRDIQGESWSFNTDELYELNPDEMGHILIPNGVLEISPATRRKLVQRRDPNDNTL